MYAHNIPVMRDDFVAAVKNVAKIYSYHPNFEYKGQLVKVILNNSTVIRLRKAQYAGVYFTLYIDGTEEYCSDTLYEIEEMEEELHAALS